MMRPEWDIILCCVQKNLKPEQTEKIRTLIQFRLDWPGLLQLAQKHGLIPLLFINLKNTVADLLPFPFFDQMRKHGGHDVRIGSVAGKGNRYFSFFA